MKKTLSTIIVLVLCIGMLAIPAMAEPASGGGGGGQDPSLPQLAAPTELQWGVAWNVTYKINEETGLFEPTADGWTSIALPGVISWKTEQPVQNQYRLVIYRVGDSGDEVFYQTTHHLNSTMPQAYISATHLIAPIMQEESPGSGTYYFTVQACGDGTQYRDSEIVTSDQWTYTAPSAQLTAPSGLAWTEDGLPTWSRPEGNNILGYAVTYYFRGNDNETWQVIGGSTGSAAPSPDRTTGFLPESYLQQNGPGYYAFKVRTTSTDITKIYTSELSDLSPARWFGDTPEPSVDNALNLLDAITDSSTEQEIEAALDAASNALGYMGTQTIKENLLTDQSGNGATQQLIEKTEDLLNAKATVAVATEELDDETADQFSAISADTDVVGAGLNANNGQHVELRLGKPAEDLVVPGQYANTVQVKLDLYEGETNITAAHRELAVPVKIKMPVPAGINPQFLAIIHHHADGTVQEIIHPQIVMEDGKYYAVFVLTSFSDFTFAEGQIRAERTGTGVVFSVKRPEDQNVKTVICAAYDKNGKMLAAASTLTSAFSSETETISVSCTPADVEIVKVFFLGNDSVPLKEAVGAEPAYASKT